MIAHKPRPRAYYFKAFWSFVKPYKQPLRIVYILYFLNSALNLAPPLSIRYYIDLMFNNKAVSLLGFTIPGYTQRPLADKLVFSAVFLAGMIVIVVLANLVGVLMWRSGTKNVEHMVFDIKVRIHDHINKLSLGYFNSERIGTIMTKAVGDVSNMSLLLRSSFNLVYALVQFLLAPVLMLMLSPLLCVIAFIPVPVIAYAFHAIRTKLKPMYRTQRENESLINSQIQEVVSGIREIKAFNMEDRSSEQYRDINWRYYKVQNRIMKIFSLNHQLQYGAKDVGVMLIAVLGGVLMFYGIGGVTVGKITAFMILSGYFYNPISQFLGFYDVVQRGMVSLERIIDFLGELPDVQDRKHALTLNPRTIKGQVSFQQVSFGYEPGASVLEDISLDATAGERIAIVGPSGSGKSTLLSLLPRFYDVGSGSIRIDGRDIRDFTQDSLRMGIGIVFQDTFLFYGSIRDNLLFANPEKTENDMFEACKAANIHDAILKLPQRYQTTVGERGVKLSGGQKQRLAIARVFIKDPPIVILDEATSAVDTASERLVQQGIERMLHGRTAFIIAHRLSTIKNCSRIIVLNNKRIAEMGTHAELIEKRGIYFDLCESNKL